LTYFVDQAGKYEEVLISCFWKAYVQRRQPWRELTQFLGSSECITLWNPTQQVLKF